MGALICRFTSSFLFRHRPAAQRCSLCGVRLVQEGVLDNAVLRITALDLGFLPVAPNLLSTHDPHAFREMARPPSPLFPPDRPSAHSATDAPPLTCVASHQASRSFQATQRCPFTQLTVSSRFAAQHAAPAPPAPTARRAALPARPGTHRARARCS